SAMAGTIFCHHCTQNYDTIVMSSMAPECDHIDHVRTQIPYALVVAMVGMLVGDIPTAYGLPPWVSLAAGVAILYLVLRYVGRPVETGPEVTAGVPRATVPVALSVPASLMHTRAVE